MTTQDMVLDVRDLVVEFPVGRGEKVHAVSGLDLELRAGETLGILGESGCGKSTAGRAIMQLPPPTSGSVGFDGHELVGLPARTLRRRRARMQLIMQDPISSLNPRRKVKDLVAEGLSIWGFDASLHDGKDKDTVVRELLEAVGLEPDVVWDRRPDELSGGQCQRVCIARALMMRPRVLICDEPVSSLDVSVQAQILNLLEETKERFSFSMVFIAHDVSVVKNISDRVMVLYLGKACEVVPSDGMHRTSVHPYTRMLLASIPGAETEAAADASSWVGASVKTTELPSPLNPPSGCRFRTRCPLATELCATEEPRLREIAPGHLVACHHVATGESGSALA
ncbi:ABC transporter ATP-binding protein [Nocardioides piscis]|uniref:ATP-binding cassette domain-containing protein n=1 Tax=Nocardioides piscis TaxID=2714938 RepID=A0A6G7YH70_9ACTN|nr:oligopeptide/dipeptide ABC transporter ATP-binding protein [Nocardioides piscis]QIK76165.1 ATP-binding cassette domain-containing protein [Nocardioides piscis]